MSQPIKLTSRQDSSVNFIQPTTDGMIEARYVRRQENYFIVYLSSQTGCRMGCRMCHLTATRQFQDEDVAVEGFARQAEQVFAHYDTQAPAKMVHFNFMARGEVFANRHVVSQADALINQLIKLAVTRRLMPIFKFSTIMPRRPFTSLDLSDIFRYHQPDIYYSLYSINPEFRRRWLPAALAPQKALQQLADWQQATRKIPVLHWALIEDENDQRRDIDQICQAVNAAKLRADVNIVRYNPFSPNEGREPALAIIKDRAGQLRDLLPASRVQIVNRVGFDVQASCGMFVQS